MGSYWRDEDRCGGDWEEDLLGRQRPPRLVHDEHCEWTTGIASRELIVRGN